MSEAIPVVRLIELLVARENTEAGQMLIDALRASDEQLVPVSAVPVADLRRIYQVRWERIQKSGIPEVLGFTEFVDGLIGDSDSVSLFEFRTPGWLFVGYVSGEVGKLGGVLALKNDQL